MNEPLVQLDSCKICGMPFGSPKAEAAQCRSYCHRCSNLPQNVLTVLELHQLQIHQQEEKLEVEIAAKTLG